MLPDRLHAYETTPLHELLAVLLRQYRRPLTGRGVKLTDAEAAELAEAIVRGEAHPQADAVRAALVDLMAESEAVLARYGLTFPDSLAVTMESIAPGTVLESTLLFAGHASDLERSAIGHALSLVTCLGGKGGSGFGRVRMIGSTGLDPEPYRAWLAGERDSIRAAIEKLAADLSPAPAKTGKRGKQAAEAAADEAEQQ